MSTSDRAPVSSFPQPESMGRELAVMALQERIGVGPQDGSLAASSGHALRDGCEEKRLALVIDDAPQGLKPKRPKPGLLKQLPAGRFCWLLAGFNMASGEGHPATAVALQDGQESATPISDQDSGDPLHVRDNL